MKVTYSILGWKFTVEKEWTYRCRVWDATEECEAVEDYSTTYLGARFRAKRLAKTYAEMSGRDQYFAVFKGYSEEPVDRMVWVLPVKVTVAKFAKRYQFK